MSKEEKVDTGPSRIACHDSLIININNLARCLRMNGKSAAWHNELGDEIFDSYISKRIVDLGCYVVLINGMNKR